MKTYTRVALALPLALAGLVFVSLLTLAPPPAPAHPPSPRAANATLDTASRLYLPDVAYCGDGLAPVWPVGWNVAGLYPLLPPHLTAMAMSSAADGWIVGAGGVIAHWNGCAWTAVTSPTTADLYAVSALSPRDAWAVGGQYWAASVIAHWNGQRWQPVASSTDAYLGAIAMLSPTDGWIGGADETILHWDGRAWTPYPDAPPFGLYAIAMLSPTDGWMGGENGHIWHWDGVAWREVEVHAGDDVTDMAMTPKGGWVVGDEGLLLRYVAPPP